MKAWVSQAGVLTFMTLAGCTGTQRDEQPVIQESQSSQRAETPASAEPRAIEPDDRVVRRSGDNDFAFHNDHANSGVGRSISRTDRVTPSDATPLKKPGPEDIQMLHGSMAMEDQDYEAAVIAFTLATRAAPNNPETHYWLGVALRKLGRVDESSIATDRALRLRPRYAEALCNAGNLAYRRGELQSAERLLDESLTIDPNLAEAHLTQGVVYQAQGRIADAVDAYRRTIRLEPDNVLAHGNLGIALDELSRSDEAIAAFRDALRYDPEYTSAYHGMGKTMWEAGRREEALEAMQQAVRLDPDFGLGYQNLALAYFEIEDYAKSWQYVHAAELAGFPVAEELTMALNVLMPDPGASSTLEDADATDTGAVQPADED